MTQTFHLEQINAVLDDIDVTSLIEEGFVAYSQGKVVVPPVGELVMHDPPGEAHIKYGYITGDDYFVIKVATGFYENVNLGIPTGTGLMLVFSQKTGELLSVLLDESHLTNIRTAAAGAVAARYLAPKNVERIGIYGAGVQGRLQLKFLRPIVDCIPQSELRGEVYKATTAGVLDVDEVLELGNVIVDKDLQRKSDDQITVFDSTGVAVQDIQVSKAVYEALKA